MVCHLLTGKVEPIQDTPRRNKQESSDTISLIKVVAQTNPIHRGNIGFVIANKI